MSHNEQHPDKYEERDRDWQVDKSKYRYDQNKRVFHLAPSQMMLGEAMMIWEKDKVIEHTDEMPFILEYIMTVPTHEALELMCKEYGTSKKGEAWWDRLKRELYKMKQGAGGIYDAVPKLEAALEAVERLSKNGCEEGEAHWRTEMSAWMKESKVPSEQSGPKAKWEPSSASQATGPQEDESHWKKSEEWTMGQVWANESWQKRQGQSEECEAGPKRAWTTLKKEEEQESYLKEKADTSSDKLGRRIQAVKMKCAEGHDLSATPVYMNCEEKKCVECGTVEIAGLAVAVCTTCDANWCLHCAFEPKEKLDDEEEYAGEEEERQVVRSLLEDANLSEFIDKILSEGYDVATLASLSRAESDELGLKSGHREKLKAGLERMGLKKAAE